jgi:hypothetical protein
MPWLRLRDAALRLGLYDARLRDRPPTKNEVKQAARALDALEPPHDHVHERDLRRIAQQILVHRFGVFQAPGRSSRPPAHPAGGRSKRGSPRPTAAERWHAPLPAEETDEPGEAERPTGPAPGSGAAVDPERERAR